ncbi:hypothetical protein TI39_contig4368g00002 [Zymoseptoria brevis]|uniref:Carrier domain-containing protein n=1 Tax=Zymoseptoria brevis TaxID=1047168 RepID=A0A0F4G753_9PEZI|nr:hypothetical protein TI39_contig4368g00002 [Zymoseptoria brevis]
MSFVITSLADIDKATLDEIAEACKVPSENIEDVYAPTSVQRTSIAGTSKLESDEARDKYSNGFQFTVALGDFVDLDSFCDALRRVVANNDVLRTRIVVCRKGLLQAVVRESHNTERYPEAQNDHDWEAILREQRQYPMQLADPLFRTALVGRKLVFTIHHAVYDLYTLTAMLADVKSILEHRVPEPRAQYKDFVSHWSSISESDAKSFWSTQFRDPVAWPTVGPTHNPSATYLVEKSIKVDGASAISPALIPSYIEAAWVLTARSYSRFDSVLYGFVFSGRQGVDCKHATALGPTIAIVPVQATMPTTVRELLKERTQARRKLYTHPALQFGLDNIAECCEQACGFQTLLNIGVTEVDAGDSEIMKLHSIQSVPLPYALVMEISIGAGSISFKAFSDPKILEKRQTERLMHQMEHYVQQLIRVNQQTKLDDLRPVNEHDIREMQAWSDIVPSTQNCLHKMFAMQVHKNPTAPAIDAHDGKATYSELDRKSTALAHALRDRGVQHETPVLVVFTKSMWAIVSLLAILKAGGVCVPVDPGHPTARKKKVMSLVKGDLVLTSDELHQSLSGDLGSNVLAITADFVSGLPEPGLELPTCKPSQLAYILATSGSTGEPKGVALEHQNLASSLPAFSDRIGLQSGQRYLHFASLVWDVSLSETIGALITGCCVCIPSETDRESNLVGFFNASKVDVAFLTPTVINTISREDVPDLQILCSGGEPVNPQAAATWGTQLRFVNAWGLTETGVVSIAGKLEPTSEHPTSIGTAVGCAAWIVDPVDFHKLVPIGTTGELVVEGPGVARGYMHDAGLTASSFVVHPPKWRPYRETSYHFFRTGDMARYNTDGSVCFLGRLDSQVKLRGQRFELTEVERTLCTAPGVQDAFTTVHGQDLVAVITMPRPSNAQYSFLNLVSREEEQKPLARITEFVESQLPLYMNPSAWFVVDRLPRNVSHKLDRRRITEWVKQQDIPAAKSRILCCDDTNTALTTKEEFALRSIWSAVLKVPEDDIYRETSFVKLGGDSILAMQVTARCRQIGIRLTVAALLRYKSLGAVAEQCQGLDEVKADSSIDGSGDRLDENLAETTTEDWFDKVDLHAHGLKAEEIASIYPCTAMQEGIVMHAMRDHGSKKSWNRFEFKLTPRSGGEEIDVDRLAKSWKAVCAAQDILRTTFASGVDGSVYQITLKHAEPQIIWTNMNDLGGSGAPWTERTNANQPPHCLTIARGTADDVLLILDLSHAIHDELTIARLCEQLFSGYADLERIRPGVSVGPYAAQMSRRRASDLQYWKRRLANSEACLLPPAIHSTTRDGEREQTQVPFGEGSRLLAFCKQHEVTAANILYVAWAAVLRMFTTMPKPVFGLLVDPREWLVGEAANAQGPMLAMNICEVEFPRSSLILDVLTRASEDLSASLEHTAFSLGELHDTLGLGEAALFNTSLSFVRALPDDIGDGLSIRVKPVASEDNHEYLIMVKAIHTGDNLEVRLDYRTSDIPTWHATNIAGAFGKVIETMLNNPQGPAVSLLDPYTTPPAVPQPFELLPVAGIETVKSHAATQCQVPQEILEDIYPCTPRQSALMKTSVETTSRSWRQYVCRIEVSQAEDLRHACDLVADAQPVLRTRIVSLEDFGHCQVVVRAPLGWNQGGNLDDYLERDMDTEFSYGAPLCRFGTTSDEAGAICLVLSMHRTICDDLSFRILVEDIEVAYQSGKIPSSPLPGHFLNYMRDPAGVTSAARFWKQRLDTQAAMFPAEDTSPGRLAHRPALPDPEKATMTIEVPSSSWDNLALESQLLAAWALCLSRMTGSDTVMFGTTTDPTAGLPPGSSRSIMGFRTDPVPLVVRMPANWTCKDLTTGVLDEMLVVSPHIHRADHDFELSPMGSILTLDVEPCSRASKRFVESLRSAQPEPHGTVMVRCQINPDGTRLQIQISSSSLPLERAQLILHQFIHAFTQIASSQSDTVLSNLGPLSKYEASLLQAWNRTISTGENECIHRCFREVARKQRLAVAIESWDANITYGELDGLSDLGASKLAIMGVGPGVVVPLMMEKSAFAIVVIMAVLKTGGAVMPLDASHPPGRLADMISSVKSALVISSPAYKTQAEAVSSNVLCISFQDWEQSPPHTSSPFEHAEITGESTCYVIFTSGSTGTPKGTAISHANVATAASDFIPKLGLGQGTRTIQATNFIFDVAMGDIFFTLLAGGCLCLPSQDSLQDMAGVITKTAANFAFITPSMASTMSFGDVPTLRTLALIGELVTREAAETWTPHLRFLNTYGPAEATIVTSCNDISAAGIESFRSVGSPVSSRYWVVDANDFHALCPIGCPGELMIEGPTVARGYLDENRSAAAFVDAPAWSKSFPDLDFSSRFYRTGDIVTQSHDGSVAVLGRNDTQVKLRGRRIELGDVEYHIRRLVDWDWNVAVEILGAGQERAELVAFLAPSGHGRSAHALTTAELQAMLLDPVRELAVQLHRGLIAALPSYMAPVLFVHIKQIPFTSVGKLDRRRLQDLATQLSPEQLQAYSIRSTDVAQRFHETGSHELNQQELELRKLWSKVVDRSESSISTNDSFFAIGGNSLRAS